jgi:hypothetical protein
LFVTQKDTKHKKSIDRVTSSTAAHVTFSQAVTVVQSEGAGAHYSCVGGHVISATDPVSKVADTSPYPAMKALSAEQTDKDSSPLQNVLVRNAKK